MRFLFTTQPGTGHLHPLLPVARGLRARGHDVAFASSAPFAAEVTAAGFTHHAVGRPWHTTEMPRAFPALAAIPPGPERYAFGRRQVFAHDTALDVLPDLLDLGRRWQPDAVVRDAAEYGGYLAAERLGIPHAVVRTDTGSSSYADRHHVGAALDVARRRMGLLPDPDACAPFRYLQLSFAPPGLDEPPFAPTCVHLRPPEPDQRAEAPSWLGALGLPIVYATLGTVYNDPALLAAIVAALADEPLELVVTTGRRDVSGDLPSLPPNVHVEPWIPQDAVLPRCAAAVAHGGYGTTSAALGLGVPMVLLPISADQPVNAERMARAGAGIALGTGERTADTIRAATRRVLDEPTFRAAAGRLAAEARRRPGLALGLDRLEALARRGWRAA